MKLVKHWQGLSKRQRPKSKCYQTLVEHHLDKCIPIKLQFFQDIAAQLKGFLQKFQTNKPMVPFLESALVDLLHTMMKMVAKPDVLDEANSSLKLAKLDLSNSENLLLCELMNLPTATKSRLRSAGLSNEKRRLFLENCKEVVVLIKKIQDRCPLKYAVARCAASLFSLNMVNDKEKCVNYFNRLVDKLCNLKWITAKDADEVKKEYFKFIAAVQNEHKDAFLTFDENKVHLDSFLCDFVHGNTKFRKCWDVVKLLFTLSHRQAAVERGFSVNKELLVENLQQLSLVSQRIVSNYLTDFGKSIIKVPLTNTFLKSCQLAHSRYTTALEMTKNEAHTQEKDRKRKLKACVCYFLSNFYFSPNDSSSKTMKNAFYFI